MSTGLPAFISHRYARFLERGDKLLQCASAECFPLASGGKFFRDFGGAVKHREEKPSIRIQGRFSPITASRSINITLIRIHLVSSFQQLKQGADSL
jgi:hypothetical protein